MPGRRTLLIQIAEKLRCSSFLLFDPCESFSLFGARVSRAAGPLSAPFDGRMISVPSFVARKGDQRRSSADSGPLPLISLPSAVRPVRSDALLCYLENEFQVIRPNRHKDGHEETLSLLIRLCFRDD
jgi:hypothetical protein